MQQCSSGNIVAVCVALAYQLGVVVRTQHYYHHQQQQTTSPFVLCVCVWCSLQSILTFASFAATTTATPTDHYHAIRGLKESSVYSFELAAIATNTTHVVGLQSTVRIPRGCGDVR